MNKIGVTLELLRETKIGFTLNDVRKVATDEELRKTCMEVLQSWKKLVKREGGRRREGRGASAGNRCSAGGNRASGR